MSQLLGAVLMGIILQAYPISGLSLTPLLSDLLCPYQRAEIHNSPTLRPDCRLGFPGGAVSPLRGLQC